MREPRLFVAIGIPEIERAFTAEDVEPAVWDVVISANALGLPTRGCCQGHGRSERPYVAFGFDYGDASPEDPGVADLRAVNRSARAELVNLLSDFSSARQASPSFGLMIEDGPDAGAMRELRARFAKQRARLLRSDPARVARNFNYRQYEDTFTLRAGDADDGGWSVGRRLLRTRQAEMAAFGLFLRQRAAAT